MLTPMMIFLNFSELNFLKKMSNVFTVIQNEKLQNIPAPVWRYCRAHGKRNAEYDWKNNAKFKMQSGGKTVQSSKCKVQNDCRIATLFILHFALYILHCF